MRDLVFALVALAVLFVLLQIRRQPTLLRSHHARQNHWLPPRLRGRFVRVASLRSSAASGLASLPDGDGGVLLALANYYGDSSLFAFDPGHLPRRAGKKPTAREVQRVSTSAAHDWEALRLPDGTEQLVVANSEATYSVVLQRNDTRLRHALPPPRCFDTVGAQCADWKAAGECERNAHYMRRNCAAACGACDDFSGPFVAVQKLETAGASAVHHFTRRAEEEGAAPRHFLAVANYKAPEQRGVAIYEWNTKVTMWERFRWLEVGGVSEFCDCETDDGRLLLGAAVWFTGSFETKSLLFEFDDESQQFRVVQTLATLGAHDLECFGAGGDGVAEQLLAVANVRDGDSQLVESVIYRRATAAEGGSSTGGEPMRFVEMQRLPTRGNHDIEPMRIGPHSLLAIANQGDGVTCNSSVDILYYTFKRFAPLQSLDVGCATYAHSFVARGRLFLAVAVERVGDDAADSATYNTESHVYEWVPD